MIPAIFDPDAMSEFLEAVRYYEAARQGMGRQFRVAVENAMDRIRETPFQFRKIHDGDQPMLDSNTIDHMLDKFRCSGRDICVPVCNGKRRNPTIFNRVLYDQLMAIEGDIGARDIIRANPERVLDIEMDDPLCFFDIDSPKDLKKLQSLLD